MLEMERKRKREMKTAAHLWPSRPRGERSCVKLATAKISRARGRLLSQRVDEISRKVTGKAIAIAASGIPSIEGLMKWSKKFSVMVTLRGSLAF